jgi:hypothetical protein
LTAAKNGSYDGVDAPPCHPGKKGAHRIKVTMACYKLSKALHDRPDPRRLEAGSPEDRRLEEADDA